MSLWTSIKWERTLRQTRTKHTECTRWAEGAAPVEDQMVCYAESPLETVQQRLSAEQKNAKHMQNKSRFLTFSQSLIRVGQLHRGTSWWLKNLFINNVLPLFSNDLTAFFNKAIKEQDVPFDTPPAQPVCAVGGHSCVTNRRESWLKRGVIWRLVTESDWALADKDNDSLRAKHCDVFFYLFFFIPRNFQCLPSICLTPGKVETPGSWAQLYRTGSCDISVNISVSC